MGSYLVRLCVYVISFMLSFWALSAVRFEQLCDVRKPGKVQPVSYTHLDVYKRQSVNVL